MASLCEGGNVIKVAARAASRRAETGSASHRGDGMSVDERGRSMRWEDASGLSYAFLDRQKIKSQS